MKRSAIVLFVLLLLVALPVVSSPKPLLHPLFSDHAVIQRNIEAPVWGWADPGGAVTVEFAGKTVRTRAAADGKWLVRLGPFSAGGPYTLTVRTNDGNSATAKDVLIGDVWICSGQSNMEMGIKLVRNAEEEIANARYSGLRLFTVPKKIALEPVDLVEATWEKCTPETVAEDGWGGFSAVAYFFGRDLYKTLKTPIGLIHTSWGGTIAEAWTSGKALSKLDDFRDALASLKEATAALRSGKDKFEELMDRWWRKNDPGSRNGLGWADPSLDDSAWKKMNLPGPWEEGGLGAFDGIVWFRKKIRLTESEAGAKALLSLGAIDDRDTTWLNGVKVGALNIWNAPRRYRIPAGLLKAGVNVIAVRAVDTGGPGGFTSKPEKLFLKIGNKTIPLAGEWLYRASTPIAETTPPPERIGKSPNVPTVLFNGMIAPLIPYAVKGAIWYQGESNAGRPYQYRKLLPTLITDWRGRFGVGEFPFLVVQLANFMARQKEPVEPGWAYLREAQLLTALRLRNVGLAVTIDIGEARDIHPKNKQDVGRRLALAALALAYGRDLEYSGPIYKKMQVEGNKIRLFFDHVDGGLVARGGGKLKGFAVAGKDRKFFWADAEIDGRTVVVSSPEVPEPAAVRYAWANNPVCNLYNEVGLPASPFRTDDWKP